MDLREILQSTRIFQEFEDEELRKIEYSISGKKYLSNSVIVDEGSSSQSLYIIKDGAVSIEIAMENDFLQLAVLNTGDFFGEIGLILNHPHSASVRAIEDSTILELNHQDLDALLNWNTVLASKLWRAFAEVLAERVQETNNKLKDFFKDCQTHLEKKDTSHLRDISKGIFK